MGNRRQNLVLLLGWLCLVGVSCADNATKLAYEFETAVQRLNSASDGAEEVVTYEPVTDKSKQYIIILIPERPIIEDDLVQKGVSPSIASDIFSRLEYVNIRDGRKLIVYQDGKLNFTTYGFRFVRVKDILVHKNSGKSRVVLKKEKDDIWVVGFK